MKYRYPKRWSRERRKRARAFARHMDYVVAPALRRCLDGVWSDVFRGQSTSEMLAGYYRDIAVSRPFIDDAEFLP